ncbi:MAG: LapA family protein [Xanthobacteraceae bacterium]
MRKFFNTAALIVIGVIILVFAIANRQVVVFSLDPLGSLDPTNPLVFAMPLFALAIALVTIGIIIGGVVTWFKQAKWRRLARHEEAEMRALRADNDRLRREMELRATAPQIAPPMSSGAISAQHSE